MRFAPRVVLLAGADLYVAEVNERVWQNALDARVKGVKKSIKDLRVSPST